MKIGLDLSSVQFAKELHQILMQNSFWIFGFVAGVVNEKTKKTHSIYEIQIIW